MCSGAFINLCCFYSSVYHVSFNCIGVCLLICDVFYGSVYLVSFNLCCCYGYVYHVSFNVIGVFLLFCAVFNGLLFTV